MTEISRVAVFGKLNSLAYKAHRGRHRVLQAARQSVRRAGALDLSRSCRRRIPTCTASSRHFELDPARLAKDMTDALDRLPRGATSISDLSTHVDERRRARLGLRDADVRRHAGPHRAPAGRDAEDAVAAQRAAGISRQFERVKLDTLTDEFAKHRRRLARGRSCAATDGARRGAGRGERRDGAGADGQAGGAQALRHRPDRAGAQGRDRPDRRARRGDPPDRRHPDAPPAEQPDPHRRGGRRQDRGGRRLRAAHRRGRRAAAAQGRVAAHARHRPAAGRRQHEGRVREPAAPGDRRGAGVAEADHPVHRRGAHADRRRRRGRHRRRRQPAQAGAGARHAAHHRRDDLGRIQEVHREGPGADAALPGRAGRRAERGEGDPDDARRRLDRWRSITACRCSTRRSRRRCGCRTATFRRGSCPTRRSACSTPPAPASRSASTRCRRRSRTAGGASRRSRPNWRSSAARRPSASTPERAAQAPRSSSPRSASGWRELEERWQAEQGAGRARSSTLRAKLRGGTPAVEGTGSALERAAQAAGGARPPPLTGAERDAALAELRSSAGEAARAAGRDAR